VRKSKLGACKKDSAGENAQQEYKTHSVSEALLQE
jgi:hypothetical protein